MDEKIAIVLLITDAYEATLEYGNDGVLIAKKGIRVSDAFFEFQFYL